MVKVNLYLTIPQFAKLNEIKQETGMAYAEVVRRALDAYLTVSPPAASLKPASAKRRVRKAK